MRLNINKLVVPVAMVAMLSLASCDTDVESLTIHNPSIEEQNPELYAQYVKSLNDYKSSDHQVTIVSFNNVSTFPSARNQHLNNMPDSVDYICINNPAGMSEVNISEIGEVRKLGTKVLGLMDFDVIVSKWEAILKAEEEAAKGEQTIAENEGEGEEIDPAVRFLEYCKTEATKQLAACTALSLDGLVLNFTGYDLNSIVNEEDIAAETARQAAFFSVVPKSGSILIFKGSAQNVMDKSILKDCKFIIVNGHSAKNVYEMSYAASMSAIRNVPTDRFVMGVTTPYMTPAGTYNGIFGDGSSAIPGAAGWAVAASPLYTKAGISIDGAEADYFNIDKIYPNIREAINLMNPTIK